MSHHTNQAKALIDAWFILLRYKWRFIFPMFIVSCSILAVSLLLPRKYKAEAIFDKRTDAVLSTILTDKSARTYTQHKASLRQEIAGGPALDQALEDLKPYLESRVKIGGPKTNLAELRADLQHKLNIWFDLATQEHERIRVSYIGSDPVVSRLIVNILVHNYIQRARTNLDQGLAEAKTFFTNQVRTTRQRIDTLENKKLTYEINHTALLPDSPNGINAQKTRLKDHIQELKRQKHALVTLIKDSEEKFKNTPETLESFIKEANPECLRLSDKLTELQNQEREYVTVQKMTDSHPELVDLRARIAQIQHKLDITEKEVITRKRFENNPKRDELKMMISQNQAQLVAINDELAHATAEYQQLTAKSANLFPIRSQYRKITREIKQRQREVAFWEDNLRRIQMAMSAENGNRGVQLAFVHPCPRLYYPISPDMTQILICAIGMGIMAGAVSLLFAHRTDETFHDGEQLAQAIELPLIGAVGEIVSARHRRMRTLRNMVIYPVNAVAMAAALTLLVSVLYLNLKRPRLYDQFKKNPVHFIQNQLDAKPDVAIKP